MRRSDPTQPEYPRAPDRIICEDERWFVRTREGLRGPFSRRRVAEAEAQLFAETMEYLERSAVLPDHVDPEDVTVVNMDQVPPWRG